MNGKSGESLNMDDRRDSEPDGLAHESPEPARKILTPEAQRALAEAAERRRLADEAAVARPRELNGRDGPEPVRYGDWEIKGIACDF